MRGLIFNYLLKYIEFHYGYDTVDAIIDASGIKSDGSYADGGMYEDEEFMKLMAAVSETLDISIPQLLESFGKCTFKHLYERLMTIYNKDSYQLDSVNNVFDFIGLLEDIHQKEVVKLYPESIFPHFSIIKRDDSTLEMLYHSQRNLPFLAKGMLKGCIEYFNEALTVEMHDESKKEGTRFIIRKRKI